MMRRRHLVQGALGVPFLTTAAQAQTPWPIAMVVPYAPGGGTDIIGRSFAQLFADELKRVVVVENRSGAAGHIGTAYAARAKPDGETLLHCVSTHIVINPHLQPGPADEPIAATPPIVQSADYQYMLAADPELGVNTIAVLIDLAKRRTLAYSSAGVGSNSHLSAVVFSGAASIGPAALLTTQSGRWAAMSPRYRPATEPAQHPPDRVRR